MLPTAKSVKLAGSGTGSNKGNESKSGAATPENGLLPVPKVGSFCPGVFPELLQLTGGRETPPSESEDEGGFSTLLPTLLPPLLEPSPLPFTREDGRVFPKLPTPIGGALKPLLPVLLPELPPVVGEGSPPLGRTEDDEPFPALLRLVGSTVESAFELEEGALLPLDAGTGASPLEREDDELFALWFRTIDPIGEPAGVVGGKDEGTLASDFPLGCVEDEPAPPGMNCGSCSQNQKRRRTASPSFAAGTFCRKPIGIPPSCAFQEPKSPTKPKNSPTREPEEDGGE